MESLQVIQNFLSQGSLDQKTLDKKRELHLLIGRHFYEVKGVNFCIENENDLVNPVIIKQLVVHIDVFIRNCNPEDRKTHQQWLVEFVNEHISGN